MPYCVYCHTSPSNKKYIGISCDPIKRWNGGKGYSKNYYFYRAICKYGWDNIKHEILYDNLTYEEASSIEKYLIEKLDLLDENKGYNLRAGGDGPLSDESRRKMSLSRIGNTNSVGRILRENTKNKISSKLKSYYSDKPGTWTGRRHSEDTILKLKNRKFSDDTKKLMRENHSDVSGGKNPAAKKVKQYSLDGRFIREYSCIKEASDCMKIGYKTITKCCKDTSKSVKGYFWRYIDE